MPLNAGDPGYGSVSAPGLSSSVAGSESAPLLIPEPDVVQQWRPLSKQELEVAAGGPGWRKVRCYLVVLFWLAWFAILATSIAIIVKSPRPVAKPLKWWQKSLFYQLQPDMFLEEKKEGSGGINGETMHHFNLHSQSYSSSAKNTLGATIFSTLSFTFIHTVCPVCFLVVTERLFNTSETCSRHDTYCREVRKSKNSFTGPTVIFF